MVKGDIVLISFPFTDLSGSKLRPAVILAENKEDITVCFITTQIRWGEKTDLKLSPDTGNGLKKESLVRVGKIATIEKRLSKGLLGRLSSAEVKQLNDKLKKVLDIS